jgi:sulfur relay (sulfurtransferase) complex TusBCD TusD component (DsrE family)
MKKDLVILFTHFGMGDGPADLQQTLIKKFLTLWLDTGEIPAKMVFYTDGVKLACQGSPVLEELRAFESRGTEIVLCQTCLGRYGLEDQVAVGVVGGMGDIIEALQKSPKVITI